MCIQTIELLRELTLLVRGECPSLLNEDSGGDARLSIAIDDALAKYENKPSSSATELPKFPSATFSKLDKSKFPPQYVFGYGEDQVRAYALAKYENKPSSSATELPKFPPQYVFGYGEDQVRAYAEACVVAATAECSKHWQEKLEALLHMGTPKVGMMR